MTIDQTEVKDEAHQFNSYIKSALLKTNAAANNAAVQGYGFVCPFDLTIKAVTVITNTAGAGALETSTVKVKNGTAATVPATLTTDVASVGAGGTAQLTAGSAFAATLSADVDCAEGDLLYVEAETLAGTDTIGADTIVQVDYIIRKNS